MSRVCELTGKSVQTGMNVSHSHIRTKRRFLPNLQNVSLISDALGRTVTLKISTAALRSVEHNNGLDGFLVKARDENLSTKALRLKKQIKQKLKAAA